MKNDRSNVSSALIMATAMMYLRLLVIIFLLDSSAVVVGLLRLDNNSAVIPASNTTQHPLELSTAIVFAFMFVFFAFITQYVIGHFGDSGLNFLSIVVGFTDIDPFILSLLSGKFSVTENAIVSAIIVASGSNNLLKAIYAAILARNRSVMVAVIWLLLLFVISLFYAFYFISTR